MPPVLHLLCEFAPPNLARQRTAPAVTLAAVLARTRLIRSWLCPTSVATFCAPPSQLPRRTPPSLSLGSFDSRHCTRPVKSAFLSCLAVIALSGCATARHGASSDFISQWHTIQTGMTAQEARSRLGKPYTSYIPTDGTNRIEYWLFTHTDFALVPPPEAYVIFYDRSGRVATFATPSTPQK